MNPLITNLFAENRYHERAADACRSAARALLLRSWRTADVVEPVRLSPAAPATGVAAPQWWAALEASETARVGDTAGCDQRQGCA